MVKPTIRRGVVIVYTGPSARPPEMVSSPDTNHLGVLIDLMNSVNIYSLLERK